MVDPATTQAKSEVRKTPLMPGEHGWHHAVIALGGSPKHPVWYPQRRGHPAGHFRTTRCGQERSRVRRAVVKRAVEVPGPLTVEYATARSVLLKNGYADPRGRCVPRRAPRIRNYDRRQSMPVWCVRVADGIH